MSIQTLEKQPSESRLYDFDFSANMATGETISTVDSFTATPSGLTLGTPSASGTLVQARISAGTSGKVYKITCRVTTSASNILELDGQLRVQEQ